MEATEDDVFLDENHSSNAIRNNGLEKYSRFHGKNEFSVCANPSNTKLTGVVRELVYQMSPYNITCVYKKVFETCALNCLRSMEFGPDDEELCDLSPSPTKIRKSGNSSEPTTPRSSEPLLVNRSNSCVYSSASETHSGVKKTPSKTLCGWSVCKRPHSAVYVNPTEQQKSTIIDELREPNKRAPGKPSCCSALPNRLIPWRQTSARARYSSTPDLPTYRKPSRDQVDEARNAHIPGTIQKSPIKVGRQFKHFRRNTSYMDQYREEYTYRKLRDLNRPATASVDSQVCRCGSPNCSSSRSTPCLSTWKPIQSQLVRPMSIPRDMTSMATMTSPMPPMKAPTIPIVKKRLQMANYVKQLAKSVVEHSNTKQEKLCVSGLGVSGLPMEAAKVEFFSSSLTVNNYNPTSTAKQSQSAMRVGGTRQLGTPCRDRECAVSPSITASERFYQNKNERGQ